VSLSLQPDWPDLQTGFGSNKAMQFVTKYCTLPAQFDQIVF